MYLSDYAARMGVEFQADDFQLSTACYNALKADAESKSEQDIENDPVGFVQGQFAIIESYHGAPLSVCIKKFWQWLTS